MNAVALFGYRARSAAPPEGANWHVMNSGSRSCVMRTWFVYLQRGAGLGLLLLVGCLTAGRHEPEFTVPGTYFSHRPCGGEEWDELLLTLLPSHVFSLQQVDRDQLCGHQVTLVFVGRWVVSNDGRQLWLDAGPTWLRRIDIVDRRTFRFPDQPSAEPPSPTPAMLAHQTRLVPFTAPFQLTGLTILVNQPE
jgi:hypothetical protein